jgi:hypothetical protein
MIIPAHLGVRNLISVFRRDCQGRAAPVGFSLDNLG